VCKARDTTNGELIALKKIKFNNDDEGIPSTAIREVCLLKDLRHDNIVELKDLVLSHNKLYLVFPFLKCDLKHFMETQPEVMACPRQHKLFIYQLLSGVAFCHTRRVMHRDLKPQNLLIDSCGDNGWTLKLADFGLSRAFGTPMRTYTHEVVTLWYRAPEILLGARHYSSPVDIWSAGCIFAEMAMGTPLFVNYNEIGQLFKIFQILGTPNNDSWPGVETLPDYQGTFPQWRPSDMHAKMANHLEPAGIDLLMRMLVYEPSSRISAQDALKHEYFADLFTAAPDTAPATVPAPMPQVHAGIKSEQ